MDDQQIRAVIGKIAKVNTETNQIGFDELKLYFEKILKLSSLFVKISKFPSLSRKSLNRKEVEDLVNQFNAKSRRIKLLKAEGDLWMIKSRKPRILIVDDYEIWRELITSLLKEDYECEIEKTNNIEDALQKFNSGEFDVVITGSTMAEQDGGMPEFGKGKELIKKIREISKIPIIFMSSTDEIQEDEITKSISKINADLKKKSFKQLVRFLLKISEISSSPLVVMEEEIRNAIIKTYIETYKKWTVSDVNISLKYLLKYLKEKSPSDIDALVVGDYIKNTIEQIKHLNPQNISLDSLHRLLLATLSFIETQIKLHEEIKNQAKHQQTQQLSLPVFCISFAKTVFVETINLINDLCKQGPFAFEDVRQIIPEVVIKAGETFKNFVDWQQINIEFIESMVEIYRLSIYRYSVHGAVMDVKIELLSGCFTKNSLTSQTKLPESVRVFITKLLGTIYCLEDLIGKTCLLDNIKGPLILEWFSGMKEALIASKSTINYTYFISNLTPEDIERKNEPIGKLNRLIENFSDQKIMEKVRLEGMKEEFPQWLYDLERHIEELKEGLQLLTQLSSSPFKALVVDDNKGFRESLANFLQKEEGYEVTTARDGQEALDILEKDKSFDVIITDKNMPNVDGLKLLERMREKNIAIPTIMITGDFTPGIESKALKAGAIKVFAGRLPDFPELVEAIKKIESKRTSSALAKGGITLDGIDVNTAKGSSPVMLPIFEDLEQQLERSNGINFEIRQMGPTTLNNFLSIPPVEPQGIP